MNRMSYVVKDYFVGFPRLSVGIAVSSAAGASPSVAPSAGGRSGTGLMPMGTVAAENIAPIAPNPPLIPIGEPPAPPSSQPPTKPPKPPKGKKK